MLLLRLTSQLARASRLTGQFLSRSATLLRNPATTAANYNAQPSSNNGAHPQQWYALDTELEEILVPRKMSISPLESWLTVQYFLPKKGDDVIVYGGLGEDLAQEYNLPPCSQGTEEEQGDDLDRNQMECKNVLKNRRRKMNRHKYKKLMKRTKFLRRKIRDGRRKRKQKRFERDLERIWRRAGLRKPPAGWITPKIYIRSAKSD